MGVHKRDKSQEKISHLMYIDNIKLFAKNEKELEIQRQDIGMELDIEKCAMLIIRSEK